MNPPAATCEAVRDRTLIERYVAGKLAEPEASELEMHYLTCARCQADIRLAAAIGGAPVVAARHPVRRWAGLGLALAAGLGAVMLIAHRQQTRVLARLGGVLEAPMYLGVPVRAAPAPADSVFEYAMTAYASRRYRDAIGGLDVALRIGADSAPAEFFRAASLLMTDRNEEAVAGFALVVKLGPTPYLPESHYYRAKGLLRLGRSSEAVAELRKIAADRPEIFKPAAALADSVEAIAGRT